METRRLHQTSWSVISALLKMGSFTEPEGLLDSGWLESCWGLLVSTPPPSAGRITGLAFYMGAEELNWKSSCLCSKQALYTLSHLPSLFIFLIPGLALWLQLAWSSPCSSGRPPQGLLSSVSAVRIQRLQELATTPGSKAFLCCIVIVYIIKFF